MSLNAPPPVALAGGIAKDRDVVEFGVAPFGPLDLEQDLIQVHHAKRLGHAFMAECRAHQTITELALRGGHELVGNALSLAHPGYVVPVVAVLIVESEVRQFLALKMEGAQKGSRMLCHDCGDADAVRPAGGNDECQNGNQGNFCSHDDLLMVRVPPGSSFQRLNNTKSPPRWSLFPDSTGNGAGIE